MKIPVVVVTSPVVVVTTPVVVVTTSVVVVTGSIPPSVLVVTNEDVVLAKPTVEVVDTPGLARLPNKVAPTSFCPRLPKPQFFSIVASTE